MKILIFCKRRPQGRDLLTRPYGRFYHLPRFLAQAGHEVFLFLLSYRNEPPVRINRDGITWLSESILPQGVQRYVRRASELTRRVRPDWVVGFSDTYYGILAQHLGRKYVIRSAIDAYDNYESYLPWLKPLHFLWRKALSGATIVTAAGPQLAELLQQSRAGKPVHIVPMAADPDFVPMARDECRKQIGLPLGEALIGYCGSVYCSRGVVTLFEAFEELCRQRPGIRLILAGRRERSVRLPRQARWLGYLPDQDIPALLNSMDLLAVVSRLSAFGRFSYPVKLYEAISCQLPVVATATEPAKWILNHQEAFLARPGDPHDLGRKIEDMLAHSRIQYAGMNTWEESGRKLESALQAAG
jgi:glycosyltransferase involved in cell wall biosynthesis